MEILSLIIMGKPLWMWASFMSLIILLLAFDLGVLHKKVHAISIKESLWLSAFYFVIAILFGIWIWYTLGAQRGMEYFTGYLIEKTLALDNIFIISLIFTYLAIPTIYQHRVLFWGIIGVIILRALMIWLGVTLIGQFSWILYIFALFLIFTGVKMLYVGDHRPDITRNPLLQLLRRSLRVTNELYGHRFFALLPHPHTGKLVIYITPLLVALIMIEFIDLVFAVDSVPAIFTITLDPYIVYTSNIFAVLGLRALYFALAIMVDRFYYLKRALALVLVFIGSKIFIADWLGLEKFPPHLSLLVTIFFIMGGIVMSLSKMHLTRR